MNKLIIIYKWFRVIKFKIVNKSKNKKINRYNRLKRKLKKRKKDKVLLMIIKQIIKKSKS